MRLPALLLASIAAAGCAARGTSDDLAPGQDVVLQSGTTVRVVGGPMRVMIERIADSRCPSDVTCVTAGDAQVAVLVTGLGPDRRDTLRLVAPPRSRRYGDYELQLVDVRPYPRSTDRERLPLAVIRVSPIENGGR